jgi:hypothetical protein
MLDDDWQKEVKIDLIFLNCLIDHSFVPAGYAEIIMR